MSISFIMYVNNTDVNNTDVIEVEIREADLLAALKQHYPEEDVFHLICQIESHMDNLNLAEQLAVHFAGVVKSEYDYAQGNFYQSALGTFLADLMYEQGEAS